MMRCGHIAQEQHQHHGIHDAETAKGEESRRPAVVIRHPAAHATQRHAGVDAAHVNARGQRARAAAMIVRNERERGGDVARLADAHERTGEEQLLISMRKGSEQRHRPTIPPRLTMMTRLRLKRSAHQPPTGLSTP